MGIAVSLVLSSTRLGLALRLRVNQLHLQTPLVTQCWVVIAVVAGGALAGASGAYLTLSITPQWAEGLTAGGVDRCRSGDLWGMAPRARELALWLVALAENTFTTIRCRIFTDYSFNASLCAYVKILLIISVRARKRLPQHLLGWVWYTVRGTLVTFY